MGGRGEDEKGEGKGMGPWERGGKEGENGAGIAIIILIVWPSGLRSRGLSLS